MILTGPDTPSAADILSALDEAEALCFDALSDLYAATWQASYVRLVSLLPDVDTPWAPLLAYALQRDPMADFAPAAWLSQARVLPVDQAALQDHIDGAAEELATHGPGDALLSGALQNISLDAAHFLHQLVPVDAPNKPFSPHDHGPTALLFWIAGARLFLLEVHSES
ncbi:MAG: hypothetical protein GX146_00220 [Myxococcales bacterium]|jgi:hypothetical protein|nr:hypothetical protein [Myxococcales bacterium]